MIRKIILFLSIVLSAFTTNAEISDYRLDLKDFSELKVNNNLNVEYYNTGDSVGYAEFSCNPEIAKMLIFSNNKSALVIQVDDEYSGKEELPKIKVYSSKLEKVENGADSTVHIVTNCPVTNFKARVIGNGTIVIDTVEATSTDLSLMTGHGQMICKEGQTFKAKLTNIGTGTIQVGSLKANQVRVMISGTGSIDCCATDNLTVYGMGSGCVYYSGNPKKVSNRSVGIKAYPVKQ